MTTPEFDKEGFLIDLTRWSKPLAEAIARNESINLTEAHWQFIDLAREYYDAFDVSPEMRPFIKWLKLKLNDKSINSMTLLKLFPDSPAKCISKIAGLPKPTNCL